jgi:hypothetical protein
MTAFIAGSSRFRLAKFLFVRLIFGFFSATGFAPRAGRQLRSAGQLPRAANDCTRLFSWERITLYLFNVKGIFAYIL